jgi:hypothetical protein
MRILSSFFLLAELALTSKGLFYPFPVKSTMDELNERIKAELLGNTNLPCIHKHLSRV